MFGRGQKQGGCDVSQQSTAQCDITTFSGKRGASRARVSPSWLVDGQTKDISCNLITFGRLALDTSVLDLSLTTMSEIKLPLAPAAW